MSNQLIPRQVYEVRAAKLDRVLPDYEEDFAVFGGDDRKRLAYALYGISRSFGIRGVVILYDNRTFSDLLDQYYPDILNIRAGNPVYDPFYGMDAETVVRAVYPEGEGDPVSVNNQRRALKAYLSIADYFAPGTPYNLDMIMDLAGTAPQTLDSEFISRMPYYQAESIRMTLFSNAVMRDTYNSLSNFSSSLSSVYRYRGEGHTGISLISMIRNNRVVAVEARSVNKRLLQYLSAELRQLADERIPFHLACMDIRLGNCEELKELFTDYHNQSYLTSVSSTGPSSLLGTGAAQEILQILNNMDRSLVLRMANTAEAKIITDLLGTYDETILVNTETRTRPLIGFGQRTFGRSQQVIQRPNVDPSELVNLYEDSVLVLSKEDGYEIIRNVR